MFLYSVHAFILENRLGAIEKKKFFEYNESVAGERS